MAIASRGEKPLPKFLWGKKKFFKIKSLTLSSLPHSLPQMIFERRSNKPRLETLQYKIRLVVVTRHPQSRARQLRLA